MKMRFNKIIIVVILIIIIIFPEEEGRELRGFILGKRHSLPKH